MTKIAEDAALELPLNDERIEPKKLNRHIVVALRHMKTRRVQLTEKIDALTKERNDLDDSIAALE